jgi:hypothetical protein
VALRSTALAWGTGRPPRRSTSIFDGGAGMATTLDLATVRVATS